MFVYGVLNASGGSMPEGSRLTDSTVRQPPGRRVHRTEQNAVVTQQRVERAHELEPTTARREVLVDVDPQAPLHEPARGWVHLLEPLLNPLASKPGHVLGCCDREPVVVDIDVTAKIACRDALRVTAEQRRPSAQRTPRTAR